MNRRCKDVAYLTQRLITIHGEDWSVIPKKSPDIKTEDEQEQAEVDTKPNIRIKEEKSDELCIDERPRPAKRPTKRKSNR